ncbi:hypothetical protein C0389_04795 [bacterium]|nr:hypothetical protein [bacterium]
MPERKSLASTIKKDQQEKANKKEELANKIIKKYESPDNLPKLSKITVMVPEELHEKIKLEAVKRKTKIRDLIIGYIKNL